MTTLTDTPPVSEDITAPRTFAAAVDSRALAQAMADVNALIGRRPQVPILAGVRLDVEGDQLTLRRTDHGVAATAVLQLPQGGHPARSTIVSALAFAAIVRAIGPGVEVTLTLLQHNRKEWLRIAGDGVTYQLLTMDAGDWPADPAADGEHIGVVSAGDFQALARAGGAASRDVTLPIITHVRLAERQGSLAATATDRYRLTDVNTLHPVPAGFSALVHADVLRHVARLARRDGDVTITRDDKDIDTGSLLAGDGAITFTIGTRTVRASCLLGEYPKVDALWPSSPTITATVDRAVLDRAVRRVGIVALRNTPVKLAFIRDALILTAGLEGDSDATATIGANLQGESEFNVALNPQLLLAGLDTVGGPQVTFAFTSPSRPAVLTGGHAHTRHLLMPVRLTNGSY